MSSLNIIKKYPELLELAYLSEREREHDLHAIFKRDKKITVNSHSEGGASIL